MKHSEYCHLTISQRKVMHIFSISVCTSAQHTDPQSESNTRKETHGILHEKYGYQRWGVTWRSYQSRLNFGRKKVLRMTLTVHP